ncbi:MAG: cytochrome c maturation protein CcmE [Rhizobiales bacterium]|nr:cytochrome c maturation protein CcmE [Hyphomicrobiales bacterium]
MTRKSKRGALVALSVGLLTGAALLLLGAMRDNVVFFRTPTELMTGKVASGTHVRIGGLVEKGSIDRRPDGLEVMFRVTDGNRTLPVRYTGILPDLFREEQGVVAEGSLDEKVFNATTVLAKHDENYMPREAAAALDAYRSKGP